MKIVIIGGVAAGSKAAAKSRRLDENAQINLYTQDSHVSYSACGLPYFIGGTVKNIDELLVRSPEEFEQKNIHIHLKHRVIKIEPKTKQIRVKNSDTGEEFSVEYDKLVIATGASPVIPKIKNSQLKNVFTLRHLEDGIAIREKLISSKRAAIIGGGYIGVELAEAFTKQGVYTTLIEHNPYIMPFFDDNIAALAQNHIEENYSDKLKLITSDYVTGFAGDDDGIKLIKTSNGEEIATEFAVIATGVRPNTELAQAARVEIGGTGAIKVNAKMETSIPNIYACGDCTEKNLVVSGTPVYIPLGSTANKEGRCAALNVCGKDDEFEGVLGSAVTRFYELTYSTTGLNTDTAEKLGFEPISVTITKEDKTGYMPEAKNITLKLIADKKSKRLLGGQGIGAGDVDKRINSLTAALLGKMTVNEFFGDDLTYAPPYSPSIDPLLTAAQKLLQKLRG